MNDKQAHKKLKEINSQKNTIGVGAFKNSRRDRNDFHEKFNETMQEMNKEFDEQRMKEKSDGE